MNTPLGISGLLHVLRFAVMALAVKVWIWIVWEYRFYFPADFSAAFLIGREAVFVGLYRAAFYAHILIGPVTLLMAAWLMFAGKRSASDRTRHRRLGRIQAALVLGVLVPSGFVMAWDSHTGAIAGWGFGLQSACTGVAMALAIRSAVVGDLVSHQRWAMRCFLCLVAPVILRVMMGASITFGFESDGFYQFNAWASWIVPLAIDETRVRWELSPLSRAEWNTHSAVIEVRRSDERSKVGIHVGGNAGGDCDHRRVGGIVNAGASAGLR